MSENKHKGIHAVIMAGGEGTRLRPMTCTMPKPLVPLLNKPVIDYCIDLLKLHGITNITTTLFYLGNMIEQHLGNGNDFGVNIKHSSSKSPLGTAGSVKNAAEKDKTILVISGDTLTDCDLGKAIQFHRENNSKVTILLKQVNSPTEYGVALIDSNKKISRFLEKPVRNEVFSNLANTGIYILEPEIIEMIPEGKAFDFSCDLFPMLMEKGIDIFGHEIHDYWCDIGDIEQYLQSQRDMLHGLVSFIPNKNAVFYNGGIYNGMYIENGAIISDKAILEPPCYISEGVEIGSGAKISECAVIGSNSKVYMNASVKRSVIMQDCIIRENVQLRGSICCNGVQIDNDSEIYEGSVIGERCSIGNNTTVFDSASIWPDKSIDQHQKVGENIIWGITKRISCEDVGITGYSDTDLSPETAVRVAASYASLLPKISSLVIACDGTPTSSMLKRAAVSGIISQGIDVYSLPYMPFTLFSFAIKTLDTKGGIYISTNEDSHGVNIILCDELGVAIDSSKRRKLMQVFSKGEVLPSTQKEIGIVDEFGGIKNAYEAKLKKNINVDSIESNPKTIVLDVPQLLYDIIAPIIMRMSWKVVSADTKKGERMLSEINNNNAAFGCYIEDRTNNTPLVMLESGRTLDQMALISILIASAIDNKRIERIAVPISFPDEYIAHLKQKNIDIVSAPVDWHSYFRAAIKNNAFVPEIFDPIACIVKLCEIEASNELEGYASLLPKVFQTNSTIPCSWEDMGRILSTLDEEEDSQLIEPVDGLKIHSNNGWVLVKSGDSVAECRVLAGSFNEEYSKDLTTLYVEKISEIIKNKKE